MSLIWVFWLWGAGTLSSASWDPTIHHTVINKNVLVEFEGGNNYNFSRYSVILWFLAVSGNDSLLCNGLTGRMMEKHTVNTQWPSVQDSFKNNMGPSGHYCIRVEPLKAEEGGSCRDGCRTATSDIFYLQGTRKSLVDCDQWDVFLDLKLWSKKASVTYNVFNNSGDCFRNLLVELWYGAKDECDGIVGTKLKSRVSFGLNNVLWFRDLKPGKYCVRASPYNATCYGQCLHRYSPVMTLYTPEEHRPFITEGSSTPWVLPTVLVISLLCVTATLALGFVYLRKKIFSSVRNQEIFIEEKIQMAENGIPKCDIPDEVLVLNVNNVDHTTKMVAHLVDFLRSCCGLHVCTIREELHKIALSLEDWIAQKLSGEHRKIVLVESLESVRRQQKRFYLQTQPESNEGLLDLVFDRALDFLMAKKSLDYKTVFVVRFGSTIPSDCCLQMVVPCKRFVLPDHLLDLYNHLIDDPAGVHTLEDTTTLFKAWKSQGSYLDLCDSMLKNVA